MPFDDGRLRLIGFDRVVDAERHLSASRKAVRNAAVRLGVPTRNLFGGTAFVPRSSADEWLAEAYANAFADGYTVGKSERGSRNER